MGLWNKLEEARLNKLEEANQILERIVLPSDDEPWFVLIHEDGKKVIYTTHTQQVYIAQRISEEVGDEYRVMSASTSYKLMHADKKFRKLAEDWLFNNRELLLESGLLIPDPQVRVIDDELRYVVDSTLVAKKNKLELLQTGKTIEVEIDEKDVIATLVRAGVMEPRHDICGGAIYFGNDWLASVWSNWISDEGCFSAVANWPSSRYSFGLAAYEKVTA